MAGKPSDGVLGLHDEDAAKRARKERKRAEEETRTLDAWERYRALNDALGESYDLIDIATARRLRAHHDGGLTRLFLSHRPTRLAISPARALMERLVLYGMLTSTSSAGNRGLRPRSSHGCPRTAGPRALSRGVLYYEDVCGVTRRGTGRAGGGAAGTLTATGSAGTRLSLKNRAQDVALSAVRGCAQTSSPWGWDGAGVLR